MSADCKGHRTSREKDKKQELLANTLLSSAIDWFHCFCPQLINATMPVESSNISILYKISREKFKSEPGFEPRTSGSDL
jgi:hypothetical protein